MYDKNWHPLDEAATRLGISRRTLQRRIKAGGYEVTFDDDGRRMVCLNDDNIDADALDNNIHALEQSIPTIPKKTEHLHSQIEQLTSEVTHLRQQNDRLTTELAQARQSSEKIAEKLNAQLAEKDKQIDQLHQLLAISQKTTATLTDQLDAIKQLEDLRQCPWWKRVLGWAT